MHILPWSPPPGQASSSVTQPCSRPIPLGNDFEQLRDEAPLDRAAAWATEPRPKSRVSRRYRIAHDGAGCLDDGTNDVVSVNPDRAPEAAREILTNLRGQPEDCLKEVLLGIGAEALEPLLGDMAPAEALTPPLPHRSRERQGGSEPTGGRAENHVPSCRAVLDFRSR